MVASIIGYLLVSAYLSTGGIGPVGLLLQAVSLAVIGLLGPAILSSFIASLNGKVIAFAAFGGASTVVRGFMSGFEDLRSGGVQLIRYGMPTLGYFAIEFLVIAFVSLIFFAIGRKYGW